MFLVIRFIFSIGENASCIAFQILELRLGFWEKVRVYVRVNFDLMVAV